MNLDFGTEYDAFRNEVRSFCDRYKGVQVTGSLFQYLEATNINNDDDLKISVQEWQKILIENGYFARHIPKEYGGYGGALDIVKNSIINEEFLKAKIPDGTGGQGIDFLVPTLLDWAQTNKSNDTLSRHFSWMRFGARVTRNPMQVAISPVCKPKGFLMAMNGLLMVKKYGPAQQNTPK